jgi:hypothetical protein
MRRSDSSSISSPIALFGWTLAYASVTEFPELDVLCPIAGDLPPLLSLDESSSLILTTYRLTYLISHGELCVLGARGLLPASRIELHTEPFDSRRFCLARAVAAVFILKHDFVVPLSDPTVLRRP